MKARVLQLPSRMAVGGQLRASTPKHLTRCHRVTSDGIWLILQEVGCPGVSLILTNAIAEPLTARSPLAQVRSDHLAAKLRHLRWLPAARPNKSLSPDRSPGFGSRQPSRVQSIFHRPSELRTFTKRCCRTLTI